MANRGFSAASLDYGLEDSGCLGGVLKQKASQEREGWRICELRSSRCCFHPSSALTYYMAFGESFLQFGLLHLEDGRREEWKF